MKATVIDYNATLQAFFKSIIQYLDNRAKRVDSEIEFRKICKAREDILMIAEKPQLYADYDARVKAGIDPQPEAFMSSPRDNSVYVILSKVLYNMGQLNSRYDWERVNAQSILLKAQRAMAYKNSKNIFKDLQFMLASDKRFAVKKEISR